MKVVKIVKEEVLDAVQFDATRLPSYWPKGIISHPGSGWFYVMPDGEEVGVSNGDWVVGDSVMTDKEFKDGFIPKKAFDKDRDEKVKLQILGAKVVKEQAKAKKKEA